VIPIIPVIYYLIVNGINILFSITFKNKDMQIERIYKILFMTATFVVALNFVNFAKNFNSEATLTNDWKNYYKIADWIRENGDENTRVVCRKPYLFHLKSRAKTEMHPFTQDHAVIMRSLLDRDVEYLVIDGFYWTGTSGRYLHPVLKNYPEHFKQVIHLSNPDTYLMTLKK
jgi:hypothetical protein